MKYLLENSSLVIEPKLAIKIGLNEAIFLRQLHYWVQKSKKVLKSKKWVFNSYEQWQEQLPFFSKMTIRRIVESLNDKGFIEICQIDKNKMNRTNFYTINYEKIEELAKELKLDIEKTPTLEDKEKKKTKEKKPNEGAGFYSDRFLQFWENYPKKIGKKLAMQEFEKLDDTKQDKAIAGALRYAKSTEMVENTYIKMPKNWLKDEYFEDYSADEIVKPKSSSKIDVLADKITLLIKENIEPITPFWEQMKGDFFIFVESEKKILKGLSNSFDFYKELEFQNGEIKAYLKGVLQDD